MTEIKIVDVYGLIHYITNFRKYLEDHDKENIDEDFEYFLISLYGFEIENRKCGILYFDDLQEFHKSITKEFEERWKEIDRHN